jgi:hypothetical protein
LWPPHPAAEFAAVSLPTAEGEINALRKGLTQLEAAVGKVKSSSLPLMAIIIEILCLLIPFDT